MHPKTNLLLLAGLIVLAGAGCGEQHQVTPTPLRETPTVMMTLTLTQTVAPSFTPSVTATFRPTPPRELPRTAVPTNSGTVTPEMTPEPSETLWPTPTPLPAAWITYTNADFHVTLRYPGQWQAESATRYSGPDGFWELKLTPHTASQFDSLDAVCGLEANRQKPAAYGAYPLIDGWSQGDSQETGCIVSPSDDQPASAKGQTTLFVRYPTVLKPGTLLVLHADKQHFSGILSTLHFLDYADGMPISSSGIYDSPACHAALPPAPPTAAPGSLPPGLALQEYAIVKTDCNPYSQFDGFRAAVPAGALARLRAWQEAGLTQKLAEANATLEPFGYRLTAQGSPYPDFDLYRGATRVVTDVTQFEPPTVNLAGNDFALRLADVDHGDRAARLVRRDSIETYDWTEAYTRPFNAVYLGNSLLSLSYDSSHALPERGISQLNVLRDGAMIYTMAIPHFDPGGGPVKGLTAWGKHWVLEVSGIVVVDGEILNDKLGYDEIFEWHLINGKPFYFFRQGREVGLSYDGQALPARYDDVMHGFLCCDPAVYNIQSSGTGVWFYAQRNGIWFYVALTSKT